MLSLSRPVQMKYWIKIGSYVVLIALACVFGVISQRHYTRYMKDQVLKSERDPVANLSSSPRATFAQTDFGTLLTYGGLFVLSVIGAGLLFAHDLSNFVGTRARKRCSMMKAKESKIPIMTRRNRNGPMATIWRPFK